MRLWGIGLLALVLVGILIVIGRTGLFDGLTDRDRMALPYFHDFERGSSDFIDIKGRSVFVAQVHPDAPLILSGLPSYASKTFRLPIDSRPVSGTYEIAFRVDAARGAQGALRITINGIKRADVILAEGRSEQKARVELTPSELASRELEVKLALIGRGPLQECTPNEAMSAVVTIEAPSGLHVTLDKPLSTTRDRLALWGSLVPVDWDGVDKPADLPRLIAAARLVDKGYSVYFGDNGLSGDDLADLLRQAPDNRGRRGPLAYPVPLLSDVANAGTRRFDRETTWRYSYAAADLPNRELPKTLDLRMIMGPIEDTRTTLLVTLNGRLLATRHLSEEDDRLNQSIALPPEIQMARNDLEVTLTSYDHDDMRCGAMRLIAAEMLPATVLQGGGPRLELPILQLRAALQANPPIALASSPLTAPDAQTAARILAELAPNRLRFEDRNARSTIHVLSGDVAGQAAKLRPKGRSWILHYPEDRRQDLVVEPLSPQAQGLSARVALLVDLPPASTPAPAPAPLATTPSPQPSPTGSKPKR